MQTAGDNPRPAEEQVLPNTSLNVFPHPTPEGMMAVLELTHGAMRMQIVVPPDGLINFGEHMARAGKTLLGNDPGLLIPQAVLLGPDGTPVAAVRQG